MAPKAECQDCRQLTMRVVELEKSLVRIQALVGLGMRFGESDDPLELKRLVAELDLLTRERTGGI